MIHSDIYALIMNTAKNKAISILQATPTVTNNCPQCFDAVGLAAGMASGL